MDAPVQESEGVQSFESSERSSKKRKLGPDITSLAPESPPGLREIPPRARSKQRRPPYPHLDSHSGNPSSSVSASTSGSVTGQLPVQSTAAVPKDHEHHPVDAKLSSLLRQFQDAVAESSQSRIEAEQESVEREHELEAQISGLADERDCAVKNGLEKEENLKTLALELWELRKQRDDLRLELAREREGRSGVDVRLEKLAEEKEQLEKELNDIRQERRDLSECLEQERLDTKAMLRQIFKEHQTANDDLHQFLLEHLNREGREEEEIEEAIDLFLGRNGASTIATSFDRAETSAIATSLQDIVSREHWTDWLDYISGKRASMLKQMRWERRKTVITLKEERIQNRKALERVSTEQGVIRKELEKLCKEGIAMRATSKKTHQTANADSQHLLLEQHDTLRAEFESERARRVRTERAVVETKEALKDAQTSAQPRITLKVSLLRAQECQASEKSSRELDKRAKLSEAEKKGTAEALAEAQRSKVKSASLVEGFQKENQKRVAPDAALTRVGG